MYRIGIDARLWGEHNTGLGIYLEQLIKELQKIDKHNHYFIFTLKKTFQTLELKSKNFTKVEVNCGWYTLKEQVLLPFVFYRYNLDLLHIPHFNSPILYFRKNIVTIHDITPILFPPTSPIRKVAFYFVFLKSLYLSSKIIAVSQTIKSDLIKLFKIEESKIKVIYQGIRTFPKINLKLKKSLKQKLSPPKPFLIYVGHWRIHKNIKKLLLAFKILDASNQKIHLVLTGKPHYRDTKIDQLVTELSRKGIIKQVNFVSRDELAYLYKEASGIILPSLSEGFGYPPLEGLSFGKKVFVSNIPIFDEILNGFKIVLDQNNPVKMAQQIIFGLQNEKIKNRIHKEARLFLKRYDFKKMARETLDSYLKTIES